MVGEHIRARRDGRWIHAIDCGDETVIQLADDAPGPASVRRSYRPTFVAGAEAVEVVRHRERTFPPVEVVARAYSRIADPALAAMFRDSEAFAAWCATGRLPPGPQNVAVAPPGASAPSTEGAPTTAAAKPSASPARAPKPSAKGAPAPKRSLPKARRTARAAAKRRPPKRGKRRVAPAARKAKKGASKSKRSRRR